MFYEILFSFGIVIALIVVVYETQLKKLRSRKKEIDDAYSKLVKIHRQAIFDYNVLTYILEEKYSKEDIDDMFDRYKELLLKFNKGKDYYDGEFFEPRKNEE